MSSSQSPPATRPAPPRYKLALLTWAGAYAVITLILAVLGPAMVEWPLALRTLLLSAIMAPAMTWVVIPGLTRLFRSWLAPASLPAAYSAATEKVSHTAGSPLSKPRTNQRRRWADDPCVQVSGFVTPVANR